MDKSSLEKAFELIMDSINKSDIKAQDKIELLINLKLFLEPQEYKDNISVLRKNQKDTRFGRR